MFGSQGLGSVSGSTSPEIPVISLTAAATRLRRYE